MGEYKPPIYPEHIFDTAELLRTEESDFTRTELYLGRTARYLIRDIFEFEGQSVVERLRMLQPTDWLGWEISKSSALSLGATVPPDSPDWRLLNDDEYRAEVLRLDRMLHEA